MIENKIQDLIKDGIIKDRSNIVEIHTYMKRNKATRFIIDANHDNHGTIPIIETKREYSDINPTKQRELVKKLYANKGFRDYINEGYKYL